MQQNSELIKQLDSAFEMRRAGDSAGALSKFESLERQSVHPRDIAALRLFQTMCLTDLERIDEALERISRVDEKRLEAIDRIDYESEFARIKRAKGRANEALDHISRALKMVDAVKNKIRVEVASKSLRALQGVLLAEVGKCDEAIPILANISIADAWWVEARLNLGDCFYKKKKYREAIDCYLSLISGSKQIHPFYREAAFRNIGYAHYDLGEYESAVEYLTQIANAYDDAPDMKAELFGILASAYSRLGMTNEAAKYSGFSRGSNSVQ